MAYYISPSQRYITSYDTANNRLYFNPMLTVCPPKWTSKVMTAMLVISAVVIILFLYQPLQSEINILLIDADAPPIYKTNERYLSVALDTSLLANNFKGFDMRSSKLHMMMLPLGGSYLRIGGTMADRLKFAPRKAMHDTHFTYEADNGRCVYDGLNCLFSNRPNFTLSRSAWTLLNRLAVLTNFTILFDLNSLRRTRRGAWDATNAKSLISFSNQQKFDLIWQLGNEPNAYRHTFNYEVTGEQLADDFKKLRNILNKYPRYKNSLLVGPDITKPKLFNEEPRQFLLDFLIELDRNVLNAITWHQYYFKGQNAPLSNFLSPDVFDMLEDEITAIKFVTKQAFNSDLPIWLGESSSAYGGGSAKYSDKFAATFIWLDKLGLAAKNGIDLIVRQSLFKGHYALLDENYDPNPDWWVSVIYKKLVGQEVIDCMLRGNRRVRLYCHCANKQNGYLNGSALVVFGSNMNYSPALVRLQEVNSEYQDTLNFLEFLIQTHASIVSKDIYLNNELLRMQTNGQLPKFQPRNITSNIITIPPYSLGFWLIPVSAC